MIALSAKGKRRAGLSFVLLLAALLYADSLRNGFHFDDFHTVVDNPAIRSLGNVPRFFTDATTFSVLPANRTYRPIVSLSLALDYALGRGYAPWAFHLGTLLAFFCLIALLRTLYEQVFDAARPGPANAWLACGTAAWFAVHPAMAETVNYVIQRGDLYCTLGCVAGLVLYARKPAWRGSGAYLVPFALAMLSKPPAAVFPLLLFGYVMLFDPAPVPVELCSAFPSRASWRRAAKAALPALVLDMALLALQRHMTPPSFTPSVLDAWAYRWTQLYVWCRYILTLFLPLHLNVDTDLTPIAHVDARVLVGCVLLGALVVAILVCTRRRTLYPTAFGLLWFVLTQVPTSVYPLSEVENDHRLFFSFPGLMLATVWSGYLVLRSVLSRLRLTPRSAAAWQQAMVAAALCVLGGYAFGAHRRIAVWRSEETLWRDDVEKSPGNGRGLMIYGLTLMQRGDYPEALSFFERALACTPNYATLEINLGVVIGALADRGEFTRVNEAEQHFRRALALAPADDTTHTFYARWLIEHGLDAEAIPELEEAVRLNPARAMPWELLAGAYARAGRVGDARQAATALWRMEPENPTAAALLRDMANDGLGPVAQADRSRQSQFWINASLAEYHAQLWAAALRSARRALVLDPHSAEAYNNEAAAYGALGEWNLAVRSAEEALAIAPALQIAHNNLQWFQAQQASQAKLLSRRGTAQDFVELSLSLYRAGRFPESLDAAQHATQLNPTLPEAWNNVAAAAEALHRWNEAIAAAREAVKLRPDFELARNNLAWSLQQQRVGVQ